MTIIHSPEQIRSCCDRVRDLPSGDAAEIGVYRGEGLLLICQCLPDVTVHGYDTFCGMPWLASEHDNCHRHGEFSDTSIERVRKRLDGHRVELHSGVFDCKTPDVSVRFVHVDVDLYWSTLWAVQWAWRNLVQGGMILCDDYKCPSCKGAKRAVDEWIATVNPKAQFMGRFAVFER